MPSGISSVTSIPSSAMMGGLPAGLTSFSAFWSAAQCVGIEAEVEGLRSLAEAGGLRKHTVDRTALRVKYFFGYGYTYGGQIAGRGEERVLPPGLVDPIPEWVRLKLIQRLEEEGHVPCGWINSAVINDYRKGGMIVSHIDPPHLFDRPIFIASFFAECRLAFGAGFTFVDGRFSEERSAPPRFLACLSRGSLCRMDGFSANGITHGIRPADMTSRRVSVVLRRVLPDAPRYVLSQAQSFYKAAAMAPPRTRSASAASAVAVAALASPRRQSFYGPSAVAFVGAARGGKRAATVASARCGVGGGDADEEAARGAVP